MEKLGTLIVQKVVNLSLFSLVGGIVCLRGGWGGATCGPLGGHHLLCIILCIVLLLFSVFRFFSKLLLACEQRPLRGHTQSHHFGLIARHRFYVDSCRKYTNSIIGARSLLFFKV